MAVVLDINIICKNIIDLNLIKDLMKAYRVTISSINSIDNWRWDNEQEIKFLDQIIEVIGENKIIIIKLNSPLLKDLGIYIEKVKDAYLYTLWINTEGYNKLDYDVITSENRDCYEKIYQAILEIDDDKQNLFEILGIGVETDFYYSEKVTDIIQNSRNIIIWILNDNINADRVLKGYKKKKVKGFNRVLFEKIR